MYETKLILPTFLFAQNQFI